ncbi:MAG: hypothetical protein ACRC4L_04055 [Mycoplasma sp.]
MFKISKDYIADFRARILQKNISIFREISQNLDITHFLLNTTSTVALFSLFFILVNFILIWNHINENKTLSKLSKVKLYSFLLLYNTFIGLSKFLLRTITLDVYEEIADFFIKQTIENIGTKIHISFEIIFKKITLFIDEVFSSKIYFKW